VNNFHLAPKTFIALAEHNLDRRRIAGHDTRGAQPRDPDGSKVVLKQSVHGTMIPHPRRNLSLSEARRKDEAVVNLRSWVSRHRPRSLSQLAARWVRPAKCRRPTASDLRRDAVSWARRSIVRPARLETGPRGMVSPQGARSYAGRGELPACPHTNSEAPCNGHT
jgi:hypothetical protein